MGRQGPKEVSGKYVGPGYPQEGMAIKGECKGEPGSVCRAGPVPTSFLRSGVPRGKQVVRAASSAPRFAHTNL